MSKKKYFTLIIILLLILIFLLGIFNKKATFKVLEASSVSEMDMDIVFYPFSIRASDVDVDSFALSENKAQSIEQNVYNGYSSVINLEILNKVYPYLSIESIEELELMLGQYCSYRNFDGTQILVFYNWYEPPNKLNVVIIKEDNDIQIISEVFDEEEFFPIAIKQCEDGAILLLRKGFQFELRKINTTENKMQSANFVIEDIPESYYYFVDIVFSDNKLYLMTNRTILGKDKSNNSKIAYLFTFDMKANTLDKEKISDSKIDFFCGNDQNLCYGSLTEKNNITVYQRGIFTNKESVQVIKCIDDVKAIISNSALYTDSQLYINLKVNDKKQTGGVLYRFDLNNTNLLNRYRYTYEGGITIKYYNKETSFTHDARYATGY